MILFIPFFVPAAAHFINELIRNTDGGKSSNNLTSKTISVHKHYLSDLPSPRVKLNLKCTPSY